MSTNDISSLVRLARYSSGDTFAGMSLVVYDYLLMFPKEVQYIWNAPWTPGKVLYLIVRYLPFFDLPLWPFNGAMMGTAQSPVNCTFANYWVLFTLLFSDMLASIVYGLRTWAIWNRSRLMGGFLAITWVGIYVGVAVYETVFGSSSPDTTIPGLPGCFFVSSPTDSSWEGYTLAMIYQMVIFLATAIRGIRHLRYERARVTSVLYRDAFAASIIQLTLGIANIIILRVTHQPNLSLNSTFRALASNLPCRIILNIREAATSLDRWDVTFVTEDSMQVRTNGYLSDTVLSTSPESYELKERPDVTSGHPGVRRSAEEGENGPVATPDDDAELVHV